MRHSKNSKQKLTIIAALVNLVCQSWNELCAEVQNCPLLGQDKMEELAASMKLDGSLV